MALRVIPCANSLLSCIFPSNCLQYTYILRDNSGLFEADHCISGFLYLHFNSYGKIALISILDLVKGDAYQAITFASLCLCLSIFLQEGETTPCLQKHLKVRAFTVDLEPLTGSSFAIRVTDLRIRGSNRTIRLWPTARSTCRRTFSIRQERMIPLPLWQQQTIKLFHN